MKNINRSLMEFTLEEFQNMENFRPSEKFTGVIFVPMEYLHHSGYTCMKFVLERCGNIVGVVGGGSDVAHINGIGGYGRTGNEFEDALKSGLTKRVGWSLDCLPKSKCIRLWSDHECVMDEFFCSDFSFYPEGKVKSID